MYDKCVTYSYKLLDPKEDDHKVSFEVNTELGDDMDLDGFELVNDFVIFLDQLGYDLSKVKELFLSFFDFIDDSKNSEVVDNIDYEASKEAFDNFKEKLKDDSFLKHVYKIYNS